MFYICHSSCTARVLCFLWNVLFFNLLFTEPIFLLYPFFDVCFILSLLSFPFLFEFYLFIYFLLCSHFISDLSLNPTLVSFSFIMLLSFLVINFCLPSSSAFFFLPATSNPHVFSAVEQCFHVQSQGWEAAGLPETSGESTGGFEPPREKVRRWKEGGKGWREKQQHRWMQKQRRKETTENNMLRLLPVGRRGGYFNFRFSEIHLLMLLFFLLSSAGTEAMFNTFRYFVDKDR